MCFSALNCLNATATFFEVNKMITEIKNGTVLSGGKEEKRPVFFENGKITDAKKADRIIDASGKYVSAGFIDLHIHGGDGYDFMDGTVEAFEKIAAFHALHGTTAMCPTGLSGSVEETVMMINAYKEVLKKERTGADFLGIHLEGPYFALSKKGAQDPKYVHSPIKEEYEEILKAADGNIVRWSAAPEVDTDFLFAKRMKEEGIIVSAGHTDADFYQTTESFKHGYSLMTHFYCAMSTVFRLNGVRQAGAVEAAYLNDDIDVEIIADGMHLPLPLLKMIHKFKGSDRVALITDAMRGAGSPDGSFSVLGSLDNGQKVRIVDGVAKLMDSETFAGSVATCDRLVRNMVAAGVSIADAAKMASATPARILGSKTKGLLEKGFDADIVIFDGNVNVSDVFVRGKKIK